MIDKGHESRVGVANAYVPIEQQGRKTYLKSWSGLEDCLMRGILVARAHVAASS